MKIVVHAAEKDAETRATKVAQAHADAVLRTIQSLPFSKPQKRRLLAAIMEKSLPQNR